MATVIVPNQTNSHNLADVIAEMKRLGPPEIRACWLEWEKQWFAIEGSHRAAAAARLGMAITIVPVDWDDVIEGYDHDVEAFLNESVTVGQIIEGLRDCGGTQEIEVTIA